MKKILLLAYFILIGLIIGCQKVSFTPEQHIERISQAIQHNFFDASSEFYEWYDDFSVRLLYTPDGVPNMFMVTFYPNGFIYGIIFQNEYFITEFIWGTVPIRPYFDGLTWGYWTRFGGFFGWVLPGVTIEYYLVFDEVTGEWYGEVVYTNLIYISVYEWAGLLYNEQLFAFHRTNTGKIGPAVPGAVLPVKLVGNQWIYISSGYVATWNNPRLTKPLGAPRLTLPNTN